MIVAKIEYWPYGNQAKAEQIAFITIANDGSGTTEDGNYNVVVADTSRDDKEHELITGRVEAYPRTVGRAIDLLFRELRETVGGRNRAEPTTDHSGFLYRYGIPEDDPEGGGGIYLVCGRCHRDASSGEINFGPDYLGERLSLGVGEQETCTICNRTVTRETLGERNQ
jgi:hypothetical protein